MTCQEWPLTELMKKGPWLQKTSSRLHDTTHWEDVWIARPCSVRCTQDCKKAHRLTCGGITDTESNRKLLTSPDSERGVYLVGGVTLKSE